jgi:hypothetical protein
MVDLTNPEVVSRINNYLSDRNPSTWYHLRSDERNYVTSLSYKTASIPVPAGFQGMSIQSSTGTGGVEISPAGQVKQIGKPELVSLPKPLQQPNQPTTITFQQNQTTKEVPVYNSTGQVIAVQSQKFQQTIPIAEYQRRIENLPQEKFYNPIEQKTYETRQAFKIGSAEFVSTPVKVYTNPQTGEPISDIQQYLLERRIPIPPSQEVKPKSFTSFQDYLKEPPTYDIGGLQMGGVYMQTPEVGTVTPITSGDIFNVAGGGLALTKIGAGAGISFLFSKPITELTSKGIDLIIPRQDTGFSIREIPAQVGRGALFLASTSITGMAYGSELAKGLLEDPLETTASLAKYVFKNPYETITIAKGANLYKKIDKLNVQSPKYKLMKEYQDSYSDKQVLESLNRLKKSSIYEPIIDIEKQIQEQRKVKAEYLTKRAEELLPSGLKFDSATKEFITGQVKKKMESQIPEIRQLALKKVKEQAIKEIVLKEMDKPFNALEKAKELEAQGKIILREVSKEETKNISQDLNAQKLFGSEEIAKFGKLKVSNLPELEGIIVYKKGVPKETLNKYLAEELGHYESRNMFDFGAEKNIPYEKKPSEIWAKNYANQLLNKGKDKSNLKSLTLKYLDRKLPELKINIIDKEFIKGQLKKRMESKDKEIYNLVLEKLKKKKPIEYDIDLGFLESKVRNQINRLKSGADIVKIDKEGIRIEKVQEAVKKFKPITYDIDLGFLESKVRNQINRLKSGADIVKIKKSGELKITSSKKQVPKIDIYQKALKRISELRKERVKKIIKDIRNDDLMEIKSGKQVLIQKIESPIVKEILKEKVKSPKMVLRKTISPRLRQSFVYKEKELKPLIQIQELENKEYRRMKIAALPLEKQKDLGLSNAIHKINNLEKPAEIEKQIINSRLNFVERTQSSQPQVFTQPIKERVIEKFVGSPKYFERAVIEPKRRKEAEEDKKRKRRLKQIQLYTLQLKRRGKFKSVKTDLSRGEALALGSDLTRKELARTFKVVKTGKAREEFGIQENFFPDENVFRQFKIRKGKAIQTPDEFIQRTKFNLQTIQEKSAIKEARRLSKLINM